MTQHMSPRTLPAAPRPLSDAELQLLQSLLDKVPAPLEPLDISMLDGYLCGVLVQPRAVPMERWMPLAFDLDGRTLPARFDGAPVQALIRRRLATLDDHIERRQWFDPWIFEMTGPTSTELGGEGAEGDASDAVLPWAAGFAMALETFPGLLHMTSEALIAPLALIYRHLDLDDLEDADELLQEIESIEPPADLGAAVEELVRATLLLADVGRPLLSAPAPMQARPHRAGLSKPRRSPRS